MSKLPHLKTPSILVILGATGDLASKKIIPSLWRLFKENLLPDKCAIVGFAKDKLSPQEFHAYIQKNLKEEHGKASAEEVNSFMALFTYLAGSFESEHSFEEINSHIHKLEDQWNICTNKVFFLAASPHFYEDIFKNLAKVKLNIPCGGDLGWTRILIEKPFGHDVASSQKLQHMLSKYFKEEQIYRIDHYLAKEIVQGIANFRFSNNLFEHSWNKSLIEKIEVRLLETIGVEQRGSFYDAFGALRDVGQNHLLELLALITMPFPEKIYPLVIRQHRAEILETLKPWNAQSLKKDTYRAQYDGYLDIDGVKKDSATETFFSLKTELENPDWQGVPIIIEAGKKCAEVQKEIVVTMKHPPTCFLCQPPHHTQNQVIFRIEPKSQILIKFWARKPGFETKLEERFFTFFLYDQEDKVQYAQEYAKLFYEAMAGDQTSFASDDEVAALWRFTEPVVNAWKQNLVPMNHYQQGVTPKVTFEQTIKPSLTKKISVIGLGKMGANVCLRLMEKGWQVQGYNKTPDETKRLEKQGLRGAYSLQELVAEKNQPKIVWLMVPAGKPVDEVLFGKDGIALHLQKGDIVIDGGNSWYQDSVSRFKKLKKLGIHFVDVGFSGGPAGARNGGSLMIGGEQEMFEKLEPLFMDLSIKNGYQFFKGAGAGHFVKMIHNGIEYGMMQALAEGFAILKKSNYKLDLAKVSDIYNHGSVIESRLVAWLKNAFDVYGDSLKEVSGSVGYTGEGEWTVKTAKNMKLKAKVIEEAVKFRIQSKKSPSYTGKVLSALRNQFGGHALK